MGGVIYLVNNQNDKNTLIEMKEQQYDSEDVLQELLTKYPNLLAGDQIDSVSPRRWLLISREMGIPSEEGSGDRWSVDHLFLDQDAIPTLVEVKRSTDTRIHREVVGQMLDYAANAIIHWPIENVIMQFEATCESDSQDPEAKLSEFLGESGTSQKFWEQAKTNLQAGKIRLVFIADVIPTELRRIVEFLNNQMELAEVIAVEIKQYIGQGLKTLVPRMVGRSKQTSVTNIGNRQWDENSFLREIKTKQGIGEANIAKAILDWTKAKSLSAWWGAGRIDGSFMPRFIHRKVKYYPISIWTNGRVGVQFGQIAPRPIFADEQKRYELLKRINSIPGVSIDEASINRYPNFPLSVLKNKEAYKQFINTLEWLLSEITSQ